MSDYPANHNDIYKLARLYVDAPLARGISAGLESQQLHYLRNVLRRQEGDFVRVFNGQDGEWLARLEGLGKKSGWLVAERLLRAQPGAEAGPGPVLYFSPIKKQRMDFLIEKAVELGVGALCPVVTRRSVVRQINEARVRAQVIEAAEQCERMDIPVLCPLQTLDVALGGLADALLYACIERDEGAQPLAACDFDKGAAFLIGPEGGFDVAEIAALAGCEKVVPVTLGETILRAETAALACLSWVRLCAEKHSGDPK